MSTSYRCPRCQEWHDAALPCEQAQTLLALLVVTDEERQRKADRQEAAALVRYRRHLRGLR